jgi:regulator of sigma E protease
VTLGVLVIFHELGHYVVARLVGVKVLRFSVGFGRIIWSRRVGLDRTEWALSAIPLGGYVKMVDEREGEVARADLPRAFNRQSVWKRIAIVAAGPVANLLLAVLLFAGTYVAGIPGERAVLTSPPAGSPAAVAGLAASDEIVAVDGERVLSWQDLRWRLLKASGNDDAIVTVDRGGVRSQHTLSLLGLRRDDWEGNFVAALGLKINLGAPRINDVLPGHPAAVAGMRAGDSIEPSTVRSFALRRRSRQ